MVFRSNIRNYTGLGIDGPLTMKTEVLAAQTLAAGDITLTHDQTKYGRIEVTTGHATNAIIYPLGTAGIAKRVTIVNNHASLQVNVKVAGGTSIVVPAGETVMLETINAGTDFKMVTRPFPTVLLAQTLAASLVLTVAQFKDLQRIEVTTGHAANTLSVPVGFPGKIFTVQNNDASLVAIVKVAGGSTTSIAATKTCLFQVNGAGTDLQVLLNAIV